jgi:hypothetical protein
LTTQARQRLRPVVALTCPKYRTKSRLPTPLSLRPRGPSSWRGASVLSLDRLNQILSNERRAYLRRRGLRTPHGSNHARFSRSAPRVDEIWAPRSSQLESDPPTTPPTSPMIATNAYGSLTLPSSTRHQSAIGFSASEICNFIANLVQRMANAPFQKAIEPSDHFWIIRRRLPPILSSLMLDRHRKTTWTDIVSFLKSHVCQVSLAKRRGDVASPVGTARLRGPCRNSVPLQLRVIPQMCFH